MKKLSVGILAIVLAFSFASCSTNETGLETPQAPLLKQVQLKRDASGAYSVDYVVASNTLPDVHKNMNSLMNEVHLNKVSQDTKDQYRNDFMLDNNTLRIGFFDNETGKQMKFSIEDENITFAKGSTTKFLKEYKLSTNKDGSIQLDFEVNNNIKTEFVFNKDSATYEVHLSKGTSSDSKFSRTLTVPDTGVLKLDFVNHNLLGKGLAESTSTIPRVIIVSSE
ncbi:hypothetical protein KCTC32516_01375 [Polaribacter huanghezhanensis]|uniref:hypothetical protein n=1 Tax=Polaribacter huanghezhanensis TaxID=1354726 RepID=UPI0026490D81|nr:hypothetical protein [Polaribacter huanghezhanensis]WKD86024.1 hypothetical protein KCTC32516_01375 [Polaribacter huanghezhanensis]